MWNDPAIVALNQLLNERGRIPAKNITLVLPTQGDRFEQRFFIQAMSEQGSGQFNFSVR